MSPNLIKKKRGVFFKEERIKNKLTQKYVGQNLGFSNGWLISKMERGVSGVPLYIVKKLTVLYKTDPEKVISFDVSLHKQSFEIKKYSRRNMLFKYDRESRLVIGKFLLRKRLLVGLSLRELANNLGYKSHTRVFNWEKGVSNIPDFDLVKLVRELELDVDEFEKILLKELKNTIERNLKTSPRPIDL